AARARDARRRGLAGKEVVTETGGRAAPIRQPARPDAHADTRRARGCWGPIPDLPAM
ncbi:MAG: hypothetical protein AVDCRST_MAG88-537, partial [uncultured Thermomicrobiales bacterium]